MPIGRPALGREQQLRRLEAPVGDFTAKQDWFLAQLPDQVLRSPQIELQFACTESVAKSPEANPAFKVEAPTGLNIGDALIQVSNGIAPRCSCCAGAQGWRVLCNALAVGSGQLAELKVRQTQPLLTVAPSGNEGDHDPRLGAFTTQCAADPFLLLQGLGLWSPKL